MLLNRLQRDVQIRPDMLLMNEIHSSLAAARPSRAVALLRSAVRNAEQLEDVFLTLHCAILAPPRRPFRLSAAQMNSCINVSPGTGVSDGNNTVSLVM